MEVIKGFQSQTLSSARKKEKLLQGFLCLKAGAPPWKYLARRF
jgi:hypothetical protein